MIMDINANNHDIDMKMALHTCPQQAASRPSSSLSCFSSSPYRSTFLTGIDIEEEEEEEEEEEVPQGDDHRDVYRIVKSWSYPNDCLEGFIRDLIALLPHERLRVLQSQFQSRGNRVSAVHFVHMMEMVLEAYIPSRNSATFKDGPLEKYSEAELHLVHLLTDLFAQMDANGDGVLTWEEFTSFIIEVHVASEENSALAMQPEEYVRGRDVRPPTQKTGMTGFKSFKKVEYPSTNLVIPRTAASKVHYFAGADVVAAIEMDGERVTFYDPISLKPTSTIRAISRNEKLRCLTHIPTIRCYAAVTGKPSLSLYSDINRGLRASVRLASAPLCLAWDEHNPSLLFGGHGNGHLFGCRLSSQWDAPVEWVNLLPNVPCPHKEAILDVLWMGQVTTASMDCMVTMWDLKEGGVCKRTFEGHSRGVRALAKNEDSRWLFSGGFDTGVLVWDPLMKESVARLNGHHHAIVKLQSNGSGHELFTGDSSGLIKLWDLRNYRCVQTFGRDGHTMTDFVSLAPQHRRIIGASRVLQVFDHHTALTQDHPSLGAIFNAVSNTICMATTREVRVWDAIDAKMLKIYKRLTKPEMTSFCLDGRQRKFFVGDRDGQIKAFDYINGVLMKTLGGPPGHDAAGSSSFSASHQPRRFRVTHMVYAHEYQTIIAAHGDRSVCIYDEAAHYSGALIQRITDVHEVAVTALAYQSGVIVTAAQTGEVRVWDFKTGRLEGCCVGHSSAVVGAELLEPYPALVTAEASGVIIIWALKPCLFAFKRLFTWSNFNGGLVKMVVHRTRINEKVQLSRDKAARKPLKFKRQAQQFERYRYSKAAVPSVDGGASNHMQAQERAVSHFARRFKDPVNTVTDLHLYIGDDKGFVAKWDLLGLLKLLSRHYLYRVAEHNQMPRPSHPSGASATDRESSSPETSPSRSAVTPKGRADPTAIVSSETRPAASLPQTPMTAAKRPLATGEVHSTSRGRDRAFNPRSPPAIGGGAGGGSRPAYPAAAAAPSIGAQEECASAGCRAVSGFRVPLLSSWHAHEETIVCIQVIANPPAVLTASVDKVARVWSTKGSPLGVLNDDKATEWKLPVNLTVLQERRLRAACEVLEAMEVEIAAENGLDQSGAGQLRQNEPVEPAIDMGAAAQLAPPVSFTERVVSLQKRVAEERQRRIKDKCIQVQARQGLKSMFRLVRNYVRFTRAARANTSSLNQCMRQAGVLSPAETRQQKLERSQRMQEHLDDSRGEVTGAGALPSVVADASGLRLLSPPTFNGVDGGESTRQNRAPHSPASHKKRLAMQQREEEEREARRPLPWELPASVFNNQLTVTRIPGFQAAVTILDKAVNDSKDWQPAFDPLVQSRLEPSHRSKTPIPPSTPRKRSSSRPASATLREAITMNRDDQQALVSSRPVSADMLHPSRPTSAGSEVSGRKRDEREACARQDGAAKTLDEERKALDRLLSPPRPAELDDTDPLLEGLTLLDKSEGFRQEEVTDLRGITQRLFSREGDDDAKSVLLLLASSSSSSCSTSSAMSPASRALPPALPEQPGQGHASTAGSPEAPLDPVASATTITLEQRHQQWQGLACAAAMSLQLAQSRRRANDSGGRGGSAFGPWGGDSDEDDEADEVAMGAVMRAQLTDTNDQLMDAHASTAMRGEAETVAGQGGKPSHRGPKRVKTSGGK